MENGQITQSKDIVGGAEQKQHIYVVNAWKSEMIILIN